MEIIETQIFTRELKANGIPDDNYKNLQRALVLNPDSGDLIPGTGGGKSGGYRIIYYWQRRFNKIYMLLIYPKGKQDNLTPDQKKALKAVIEEI